MKTPVSIIAIALLQIGCATISQSDAIQVAAERGKFDGINKYTEFYVTLPSSHSGPFSDVELLNFQVANGSFKDSDMSAVMGKSRETKEWELLMLFSSKGDGHWAVLPEK
ncbi:MAG TPA: hypothetical protein ENJ13_05810 [Chromatiales bacterium]|nr:hypothetical protein [Chromatiales bacterium]